MNKKTIYKKIIGIILVTIMLFSYSSSVMAKVNEGYTTSVNSATLNKDMKNSTLLNAIAKLVFAVAEAMEWLLGAIFKALTGTNDFPWADKIVFNAVPLLDINFINPSSNSFLGQDSIKDAVKNVYQTVFSMATAAFGIIVLVMAIKLVISTIASEKAKYKEALVNWVTGLVMLYMMHFFISFMFYLNETLVEACSKITEKNLQNVTVSNAVKITSIGNKLIERSNKYPDVTTFEGTNVNTLLKGNPNLVNAWNALQLSDNDDGITSGVKNNYEKDQLMIIGSIFENITEGDFITNPEQAKEHSNNSLGVTPTSLDLNFFLEVNEVKSWTTKTITYTLKYKDNNGNVHSVTDNQLYAMLGMDENARNLQDILAIKSINTYNASAPIPGNKKLFESLPTTIRQIQYLASAGSSSSSNSVSTLLSNLATAFKLTATDLSLRGDYDVKNTIIGEVDIPNMLMYAILVGQSLVLFVAYIKRLFYVLILAILSPIVVVYDFYQKSMRG